LYGTRVTGLITAGGRVVGVEADGPDGPVRLRARAVVDATGTAEAVRLLDPALLQDDPRRAAGGLVFRMRGGARGARAFPGGRGGVGARRRGAGDGTRRGGCRNAWVDAGVYGEEAYVKLAAPLPADWREREARGELTHAALQAQAAIVPFLRR